MIGPAETRPVSARKHVEGAGPEVEYMYTLPHQVEFLSDAWILAAERFLTREVEQRKLGLGGPFSISERFTHAPPHLKFDRDVGAWHVRYDGDRVHVGRGFVD